MRCTELHFKVCITVARFSASAKIKPRQTVSGRLAAAGDLKNMQAFLFSSVHIFRSFRLHLHCVCSASSHAPYNHWWYPTDGTRPNSSVTRERAYLLPQLSPVGDNLLSLRAELALEFANDGRRLFHCWHLQCNGTITSLIFEMSANERELKSHSTLHDKLVPLLKALAYFLRSRGMCT